MLAFISSYICLFLVLGTSSYLTNIGPLYKPTKGEIWPQPQHEIKLNDYFVFRPGKLKINIAQNNCPLLHNAILRFKDACVSLLVGLHKQRDDGRRGPARHPHFVQLAKERYCRGQLDELVINLTMPCEAMPHLDMDESYILIVVNHVASLESGSIWGIMRGLDSLAQLIYIAEDFHEMHINVTHIVDYPRYKHRGLLLDTSRHYISVENILTTLEAMAINKMNVFHWHIVDDQSFPYVSEKFPKLSQNGAFSQRMVYNKLDITKILFHATNRGIRVVPEFDVPGHTSSWGATFPEVLTKCKGGNLGPMNPIGNTTYQILQELFKEVSDVFPDQYFHVGGDEVDTSCWQSNPEIIEYMKEHNITNVEEMHALFMTKIIPLLAQKKVIVWQEVFDEGVPLSEDALIQIWKNGSKDEMRKVISKGYKVLFSSLWYLDDLTNTFSRLYVADPSYMVSEVQASNIMGGEACMWGEKVDDTNVISRVWPRASAVAEILWSTLQNNTAPSVSDLERIEEHTCRMRRRGILAEPPSGPGYCVV